MSMVVTPWADLTLEGPQPADTPPAGTPPAGTPPTTAGSSLVVPAGCRALVTSAPAEESLLPGDIRLTGDVDEFRSWFSVPGDRFQSGLDPIPREHLPTRAWTRGTDFDPGDLTEAELEDLRRATMCYLFGHTPLVRAFRGAIEQYYAPFGAAFYRGARIEVEAGATLAVRGHPAVVDLDELVVHEGGGVFVHTPVRLATRTLSKVA